MLIIIFCYSMLFYFVSNLKNSIIIEREGGRERGCTLTLKIKISVCLHIVKSAQSYSRNRIMHAQE